MGRHKITSLKVILTGANGNLGSEIHRILTDNKIPTISLTRDKYDLLSTKPLDHNISADCIIHSAGIVSFHAKGNPNTKMMENVILIGRRLKCPIFYVSSAYAYTRNSKLLNNNYERDKYMSEKMLKYSSLPYAIFRPSVITGSTKNGKIQNYNGYYTLCNAFLTAINESKKIGKILRFPELPGYSDIVPVDKVADFIVKKVLTEELGEFFLTNPFPPKALWVMENTLKELNAIHQIEILNVTFDKFRKMELTSNELSLLKLTDHFLPYWEKTYKFNSSFKKSFINSKYMIKLIKYFKAHKGQ